MNIAIIGASKDRKKFGNKAVRAYKKHGDTVFPVNPKEEEIEGLKCYPSILDIKEELDFVSFYVRPDIGITLIEGLVEKGVKNVYINPGAESDELIKELKKNDITPTMACSIRAINEDPKDY